MTKSTPELRRIFRDYHEKCRKVAAQNERSDRYSRIPSPPFPEEIRGLECGARTRKGTPCKMTSIYLNGRCKLHGGLSTGPKSAEGWAAAQENLKRRWKPMGHLQNLTSETDTEAAPATPAVPEIQSHLHDGGADEVTPTDRLRSVLAQLYGEAGSSRTEGDR